MSQSAYYYYPVINNTVVARKRPRPTPWRSLAETLLLRDAAAGTGAAAALTGRQRAAATQNMNAEKALNQLVPDWRTDPLALGWLFLAPATEAAVRRAADMVHLRFQRPDLTVEQLMAQPQAQPLFAELTALMVKAADLTGQMGRVTARQRRDVGTALNRRIEDLRCRFQTLSYVAPGQGPGPLLQQNRELAARSDRVHGVLRAPGSAGLAAARRPVNVTEFFQLGV